MLRSYALSAAGITLRIYIGISSAAHLSFNETYPFIAWLCWVPTLLIAEWIVRRTRRHGLSHGSTEQRFYVVRGKICVGKVRRVVETARQCVYRYRTVSG